VAAITNEPAPERTALERMLEARSVAVVGASVKEGSLGRQMMSELVRGGFDGRIYPVNPGYDEVLGHRCFPSIADVPEPADLAILGVANRRIEAAIGEAAAAGAASAVTFSSLHEDDGAEGAPPLAARVAAIAREHGMALCGGNGMGFLNLEANLRATGFATPDAMRLGPVSFVSHSGSAFAALAFNDRRIGFNLVVSSGQEIVTRMADYMAYALSRSSTRVLALLIETVRDPAGFMSALALAAEREVAVIALTVGRTERSKSMVATHSGALAGEHGAYEAVFDTFGVHEVTTLDEMADTMELFSSPRRVGGGRGIASVHDSGGERALLADLAGDLGVPFASISEQTRSAIQAALDPGLVAENPLDAWGTGIDADRIFRDALVALHDDPDTAALVFAVDLTRQGEPYDEGYLQVALDVFAATSKPFCVLSNLASAVDDREASMLREAGIPVLEGTDSGLRALLHLLHDHEYGQRPPVRSAPPVSPEVRERWQARLASGDEVSELEGLELLADYGIRVVAGRTAGSPQDARAAAAELGYPVVLKTAAPGVGHKSDVDGVRLGLAGPDELDEAYRDLAARLGPQVVVARMAPPGVEIALGVVRDATFGPLVLVAAGGVWVEVLGDRRLAMPPLDKARARRLVDGLRVRPLLDGMRGDAPSDVDALADAVANLSRLAIDLGAELAALDVNPVVVSAGGCVAVDALVVPTTA
jgi:acetate---CoA ligase (ADP-forming)